MTEDHKRLLAVFEVRVRDLMELCDKQKQRIGELEGFLVQKEEELQQAIKTIEELKTDFTNNMTHELKTPISVAYAANDVLLNYDSHISEKQKKYLGIVREQLTQLSGLVEQILTLSVENRNTFRLKQESIRIADMIAPLIEQHKLKAGKKVDITTNIPENIAVFADRTHFYNILGNLIDNAVKYSGDKPAEISVIAETLTSSIIHD